MGFFSKNKDENLGFIINFDDDNIKISGDKNLAPHAITADEVSAIGTSANEQSHYTTNTGALDSLKKRMNVSIPETPKSEKVDLFTTPKQPSRPESGEPIKKVDANNEATTQKVVEKNVENSQKTLIEKVKRYTIDEQGNDVSENNEPLYQLQSVAEILLNNGENAMKDLSKKYGLDFVVDNLGKEKAKLETAEAKTPEKTSKPQKSITTATPTPAFEQMVSDAAARESKEIYDSLFQKEKPVLPLDTSVPDISDIDTHEVGVSENQQKANTATIRFTPIKDKRGNTDHITISSVTRHIDLGDDTYQDISSKSTVQNLEQSDFDKFAPEHEVNDLSSGKKLLYRYALKKRSSFLGVIASFMSLIALSVFLIPPVFDFIIGNPKNAMFICGAFLLVSVFANISMFADFKNLFKKRCGFDILASLCTLFTLSLCVTAALTKENAYYNILMCSFILLVRSICKFKEISLFINNLKRILTKTPKKAIALLNDPATTFAMAKNTIDGDVLIAAHRNTNFVNDYVKHSTFSLKLSGRCSIIFYFTLFFALISAVMGYFYYQSFYAAIYSATVVSSIISMPSLFFINSLPLSSAAKKLNPKGAMIAGMHGAEKIELTNAAVVDINDIFPSGSVKMYSMKVLSDNNIDDTILRAASLTAAVNSPLEAIFKQIAGTNASYSIPDSDTVKYEKNLGISGWVNNELLFIGNRSLMQAHGIAIPSLETDRKILRRGYFPVYVATTDTACALIIIQYDAKAEISKELRKVTDLGLTLLVKNCDPNINEQMICDYFGLYEDSVKILSNAGVYMYKNATMSCDECSAPAAYRGSNINLIKIINCASMIKKSNKILTVLYSIFAVLGLMYFIYAAFSGVTTIPTPFNVLAYELTATILSIIGFLIQKP